MRRAFDASTPSLSTDTPRDTTPRLLSGIFPAGYEIGVTRLDQVLTQESEKPELPSARRPSKVEQRDKEQSQPTTPQTQTPPQRTRSSKKKDGSEEKRRSLSMYGFEDLKMTKKLNQDKFPMLVRIGRSFSRRMSG